MKLQSYEDGNASRTSMEDPVDRLKRVVDEARKKLERRDYAIDASMAYVPREARKQVSEVKQMKCERYESQDGVDDQV